MRYAFRGLVTAYDFSVEKELLDLVLGQGWLVGGKHGEPATHKHYGDKNQSAPFYMECVHGRSSTERLELYSFTLWPTTK
jgi:hypothetical protein